MALMFKGLFADRQSCLFLPSVFITCFLFFAICSPRMPFFQPLLRKEVGRDSFGVCVVKFSFFPNIHNTDAVGFIWGVRR